MKMSSRPIEISESNLFRANIPGNRTRRFGDVDGQNIAEEYRKLILCAYSYESRRGEAGNLGKPAWTSDERSRAGLRPGVRDAIIAFKGVRQVAWWIN